MRKAVILICADAEWLAVKRMFADQPLLQSPFGEYFINQIGNWHCFFAQTGWGKIAAAAGTQYVIDEFHPDLLINFGTCGGFGGLSECGQIILAERTIVYDIQEKMGDADEHISHYTTIIDLSWLNEPLPLQVRRASIVSADRDLISEEIPKLIESYQAFAGDWESGAIAWVAQNNRIRLLILRGITDLVSESGSPAYGGLSFFQEAATRIMDKLICSLPDWLKSISFD